MKSSKTNKSPYTLFFFLPKKNEYLKTWICVCVRSPLEAASSMVLSRPWRRAKVRDLQVRWLNVAARGWPALRPGWCGPRPRWWWLPADTQFFTVDESRWTDADLRPAGIELNDPRRTNALILDNDQIERPQQSKTYRWKMFLIIFIPKYVVDNKKWWWKQLTIEKKMNHEMNT